MEYCSFLEQGFGRRQTRSLRRLGDLEGIDMMECSFQEASGALEFGPLIPKPVGNISNENQLWRAMHFIDEATEFKTPLSFRKFHRTWVSYSKEIN
jgi:hypothetical protein